MEFPFDINQLFSERVSVLDHTLVTGRTSAERPDLQAHVATVINELGKASAKAQQLTAPVTSASKLQTQGHQLYLLKDGESSGGRGRVLGFLKVGYKKLFLLDRQGVHVEVEPLCVLDFYIAENLQRHGYGRELFEFMLQHNSLEPVVMAYDRPSPKFLSFLAKHYSLLGSVPQVNNFVVFEGFFLNRAVVNLRKVPPKKPDGEIKPYSSMEREAVRQEQRTLPWPFAPPHSPQRVVSSQSLSMGSSPSRALHRGTSTAFAGSNRESSPQSPLMERCRVRRTSFWTSSPSFQLWKLPQSRPSSTGSSFWTQTVQQRCGITGVAATRLEVGTLHKEPGPLRKSPPSLNRVYFARWAQGAEGAKVL